MQGNRGGRHPFFESDFPFPEFGYPFPGFGDLGGFGGNRSLFSSILGGRDSFDDPFFTNPLEGMFESNFFGSRGHPFMGMHPPPTMIENHSQAPQRRGPIIEQLNSDEEKEDSSDVKKENPRKHGRSSGKPDAEDTKNEMRRRKYMHHGNDFISGPSETTLQSQGHSFTFHSSTVSYGGANGSYYTSSRTRRSGGDGVVFEECKEADSSTMQATHRISRGIHNKGHSVTRKLVSDGKVDTIQTLHNIGEDQLLQFKQNWKGNAGRHLPGWSEHLNRCGSHGPFVDRAGTLRRGKGYALPSTELPAVRPDSRDIVQLHQGQHSGSGITGAGVRDDQSHQRDKWEIKP